MDALGIDIKLLLAQSINFLLFFIIFKKFIAKPFGQYLKKEREAVEKQQIAQQSAGEILEQSKNKADEIIAEARQKGLYLVKEAEEQADNKRNQILVKAKEEADLLKKKMKSDMDVTQKKNYQQVKQYIIANSLVLSNKVLKEYIDDETQTKLIKNITDKLAKDIKYEN